MDLKALFEEANYGLLMTMLSLDPGGCSFSKLGNYPLDFNGEKGEFCLTLIMVHTLVKAITHKCRILNASVGGVVVLYKHKLDEEVVYYNDCSRNHFVNYSCVDKVFKLLGFEVLCKQGIAGSSMRGLIVAFFGDILKKWGSEKLCDEITDETPENSVKLFVYIYGKVLFAYFNWIMLAWQLLSDKCSIAKHEMKILMEQGSDRSMSTMKGMVKQLAMACGELCDVLGLMYHALVVKLEWESYDFVQNGLVHLYDSCEQMGLARKLFDVSGNRDVLTWTVVLNGYVKCRDIGAARELFDQMPERNSVSWSTMINGYVQVRLCKEALELFNDMRIVYIQPNHAAIVGALSACASVGALDQGRWIHAFVNRSKMMIDEVLGTVLVDMYAKLGLIDMACCVFAEMSYRDMVAYTSLICGLAIHSENAKALELFRMMQIEGIKQTEATFIGVLNAYKQMGLVQELLKIFGSMKQVHGIKLLVQHYGFLGDPLGRAGMLEQALTIFNEMPVKPDFFVLGALLNACTVHNDTNMGKEIVNKLSDQSLDHEGAYVLLSNMHAAVTIGTMCRV